MPLVAVLQMTSTSNVEANWRSARELIDRAVGYGAELVATPENTNYLGPHEEKVRRAEPLDGPTCTRFAELSRRHGIHLLLGSFNEMDGASPEGGSATRRSGASAAAGRCYNTSVLFGPDGRQLAVYRKIHLFDVDVAPEVSFTESATVRPGAEVVTATTPLGTLGLSICYDLRFAELYRALTARGAEILAVPSAFTATTGQDHWQVLIRARAIETQCWVLAPAQYGLHDDEGLRHSYGHAMIVDPWGDVVAMAPAGPGLAVAEVNLERVAQVRRAMPVEKHRRL